MSNDQGKKKKRNIIRDFVSQKKKDREWLFIKRKEKKDIFRDLVSKKEKKKKDTRVNPCLARGKNVVNYSPVLWVYSLVKYFL